MNYIKKVNKNIDFKLFMLFILSLPVYKLLNRPFGKIHSLFSFIDKWIPLVPAFILVYHSWMPFLLTNLFFFSRRDRKNFRLTLSHLFLSQWAAYITFLLFKTKVPRLAPSGNTVFENLIKFTYKIDKPYAAFPSIHAMTTFILIFSIFRSNWKLEYKAFSVFFSLLILASILLVKQHVFLDLLAGLLYAQLLYRPSLLFLQWMENKNK